MSTSTRSPSPTSSSTQSGFVTAPGSPAPLSPNPAPTNIIAGGVLNTSSPKPAAATLIGDPASKQLLSAQDAVALERFDQTAKKIEAAESLIPTDANEARNQLQQIIRTLDPTLAEDKICYCLCGLGLAQSYSANPAAYAQLLNVAINRLDNFESLIQNRDPLFQRALFTKAANAISKILQFADQKLAKDSAVAGKASTRQQQFLSSIASLTPAAPTLPAASVGVTPPSAVATSSAPPRTAAEAAAASIVLASPIPAAAGQLESASSIERELETAFGLLESKEANKLSEARGKFESISNGLNTSIPSDLIHLALCKLGTAQTFSNDITNARHFFGRAHRFLTDAERKIQSMADASLKIPLYVKMQQAYTRVADSAQTILGPDSANCKDAQDKLAELEKLIPTFAPAPTSTASPAVSSHSPAAASASSDTTLPSGTVAIQADPSKFLLLKNDWSLESNGVERDIRQAFQYLENGNVDEARRNFSNTSTCMTVVEPKDKINYALCIFGKLFCLSSLEQVALQQHVSYAFEQLEKAERSLPKQDVDVQKLLYQRMELLYQKIGSFLAENSLLGADIAAQKAQFCLEKITELSTTSVPPPSPSPAPAPEPAAAHASSTSSSASPSTASSPSSTGAPASASMPSTAPAPAATSTSSTSSSASLATDSSAPPSGAPASATSKLPAVPDPAPAPAAAAKSSTPPAGTNGSKSSKKVSNRYFTPRLIAITTVAAFALGAVGFYYAQPSLFASLRTRAVNWLREQLKRYGIYV